MRAAKLGWIVTFKQGGIYIYATQETDRPMMQALAEFNGLTVKATGTLRYALGSLSPRTDVANVPAHFFFDVAKVKVISWSSPRPSVAIKFREMRFGIPPLVYLHFDVLLRNSRTEPRWFLLPNNLPQTASVAAKGGINNVEVFAPHGAGRVIIGHFLGTGGFQALLLPAGAEVRLRLFPISFWGDLPDHLQVEVVLAKRLTVGGEEAEAWFSVNPTTSVRADIQESPEDWTRQVSSRATPDNREVATFIDEDSRIKLQISLSNKQIDSPRKAKPHNSFHPPPR